jgi:hypothetical protein
MWCSGIVGAGNLLTWLQRLRAVCSSPGSSAVPAGGPGSKHSHLLSQNCTATTHTTTVSRLPLPFELLRLHWDQYKEVPRVQPPPNLPRAVQHPSVHMNVGTDNLHLWQVEWRQALSAVMSPPSSMWLCPVASVSLHNVLILPAVLIQLWSPVTGTILSLSLYWVWRWCHWGPQCRTWELSSPIWHIRLRLPEEVAGLSTTTPSGTTYCSATIIWKICELGHEQASAVSCHFTATVLPLTGSEVGTLSTDRTSKWPLKKKQISRKRTWLTRTSAVYLRTAPCPELLCWQF